jgi:hypothetical protein
LYFGSAASATNSGALSFSYTSLNSAANYVGIGMNGAAAASLRAYGTYAQSTGQFRVSDTAASTSTTTGALTVAGGVGIVSTVYIGGITRLIITTASTSTTTGALIVSGGVGIAGNAWIGGTMNVAGITRLTATTASTSTTTGALIVSGGVGIASTAYIGGVTKLTSVTDSTSTTTGTLIVSGGVGIAGAAYIGGVVRVTNATVCTSKTTGALVVTGGVGIGSSINIGGTATVQGITYFNDYALFNGGLYNQRKIVFYGDSSNYYQYRGIGMDPNNMIYHLESVAMYHSFRAGTSSTTDQELMRIDGNLTVAVGVHIYHNTANFNATGGALVVDGGVGVGKSLYVAERVNAVNMTCTTAPTANTDVLRKIDFPTYTFTNAKLNGIWTPENTPTIDGFVTKNGRLCTFQLNPQFPFNLTDNAGKITIDIILPAEYRPATNSFTILINAAELNSVIVTLNYSINTDGTIEIANNVSNSAFSAGSSIMFWWTNTIHWLAAS